MLILRRRAGESLLIGDEIEIEVLDTGTWGVKVGIRAPKSVSILRKELQMIRAANYAAARDVRIADLARSVHCLEISPTSSSHKSEAPR